ncbi:spore germination protein [Pontibacillus yanchengensis]|uniref:Spore germination protein n=2 Tax=Pontibacillus yanchengensis TaxID=462910 RepID=A0ACC7VJD0_9BACI|nr:spore germination protein [Pontibacillus yanchengensis]MYL32679.1 spore germination protein [Pontibacillus yanchengensis]MYL55073.1 spore germination protein [Pontibacillus yanchengensis]
MKSQSDTPIFKDLKDTEKFMEEHAGVGVSFDLGFRKIIIFEREIDLFYLTGLCDTQYIIEIMEMLVEINDVERHRRSKLVSIIENRLVHQQVRKATSMNDAITQMLSGLIVIFIDGSTDAFIVDVRSYPGRSPSEPDTEKVVRGSRDGYTENIIENTALTRRRVRDERLRHEIFQVGERSKTDICISYLKDVADPGLIELIKREIKQIDTDGLSMADKTVEEFIVSQGKIPFPLVRYTERPDVASAHLFEGHVLIMVDTSPSMIITPTTFFHHVQHAEEYRQTPIVGSFVRWIRYFGIFASLFLLPLWMLFVMDPTLLPANLQYIGPQDESNVPVIIQLILADIGIEFLRIAAIHTPTPLSTAMGLIAAVLIGQIAIDVGLFIPEVILYVSVAAIGSFSTPSYELSVANKISRLILITLTALFGIKGFMIGCTLYILMLTRTNSLNTPYFWPFIPFNFMAMIQILFRVSVPLSKKRPSIVHPRNDYRK